MNRPLEARRHKGRHGKPRRIGNLAQIDQPEHHAQHIAHKHTGQNRHQAQKPRANTDTTTVVSSEAAATARRCRGAQIPIFAVTALPMAMFAATASDRPMIMMIGPITTGGMAMHDLGTMVPHQRGKQEIHPLTHANAPMVADTPQVCVA